MDCNLQIMEHRKLMKMNTSLWSFFAAKRPSSAKAQRLRTTTQAPKFLTPAPPVSAGVTPSSGPQSRRRPITVIINSKDDGTKRHPYPFQPSDLGWLHGETFNKGVSQSIEISKTNSQGRYLFDHTDRFAHKGNQSTIVISITYGSLIHFRNSP